MISMKPKKWDIKLRENPLNGNVCSLRLSVQVDPESVKTTGHQVAVTVEADVGANLQNVVLTYALLHTGVTPHRWPHTLYWDIQGGNTEPTFYIDVAEGETLILGECRPVGVIEKIKYAAISLNNYTVPTPDHSKGRMVSRSQVGVRREWGSTKVHYSR